MEPLRADLVGRVLVSGAFVDEGFLRLLLVFRLGSEGLLQRGLALDHIIRRLHLLVQGAGPLGSTPLIISLAILCEGVSA